MSANYKPERENNKTPDCLRRGKNEDLAPMILWLESRRQPVEEQVVKVGSWESSWLLLRATESGAPDEETDVAKKDDGSPEVWRQVGRSQAAERHSVRGSKVSFWRPS